MLIALVVVQVIAFGLLAGFLGYYYAMYRMRGGTVLETKYVEDRRDDSASSIATRQQPPHDQTEPVAQQESELTFSGWRHSMGRARRRKVEDGRDDTPSSPTPLQQQLPR